MWPVVLAILSGILIAGGLGALFFNSQGDDDSEGDTPAAESSDASTTEPDADEGNPDASTSEPEGAGDEEAGQTNTTTGGSVDASLSEDAGLIQSDGDGSTDLHKPIEDVGAVAEKIAPSVVTISADVETSFGSGGSIGTGVMITPDGNILTNAHVVQDAVAVRVLLPDTTEPVAAEVLAADPQNDLALLDISGEGYTPAVFAKEGGTELGDPVVAVGFALDLDGEPSVTLGIVSATNRTLQIDEENALDGLIQTDAAISSGNSGGPLVNAAGEVVGINTAVANGDVFSTATNLGFAISVGEILQVVPDLRNSANGEVRQSGYLGVFLVDREDGGKGAVVERVEAGTPAAEAGLQDGDIVLDVDGAAINGRTGLIAAIRDREPGDTVTITVLRNGQEQKLEATLAEPPPPPEG